MRLSNWHLCLFFLPSPASNTKARNPWATLWEMCSSPAILAHLIAVSCSEKSKYPYFTSQFIIQIPFSLQLISVRLNLFFPCDSENQCFFLKLQGSSARCSVCLTVLLIFPFRKFNREWVEDPSPHPQLSQWSPPFLCHHPLSPAPPRAYYLIFPKNPWSGFGMRKSQIINQVNKRHLYYY